MKLSGIHNPLESLRPQLAQAANRTIQTYDWTTEGIDSGACGDVAESMQSVILAKFPTLRTRLISRQVGDAFDDTHHTALAVWLDDVKWIVDISPWTYEDWDDGADGWVYNGGTVGPSDIEISSPDSEWVMP